MPKDIYLTTEATIIGVSPISGMGKAILVRYDICARCGTRRCTKAERETVALGPPPRPMPPMGLRNA